MGYFIVLLGVSGLALLVLYVYVKQFLSPLNKMPGPILTNPLLGDLAPYIKSHFQVIQNLKKFREKYGTVRRIHMMFGEPRVEVADPEWAYYILTTNARNYRRGNMRGVEGMRNVVGDTSLLMIDGSYHRQLRRLANPGFKQSLLVQFLETFSNSTQQLLQKWDERILNTGKNCAEIQVKDDLSELTLNIIGLTAFGYDFNRTNNDLSETFRNLLSTSKVTPHSLIPGFWKIINVLVLFIPEPLLGPLDGLKMFLVRVAKVHKYMRQILREIIYNDDGNNNNDNERSLEKADSRNLISIIIKEQSSGALSETELQDMVLTFVLAGHETSSLALTWFLLMMSQNVHCQEKCREEVRNYLPPPAHDEPESNITWELLQCMKYLTACVYETLRLFPPAPFINRRPINDDVIKGYCVPKDTDILITIVDIHRNESFWTEPERFYPERFLDPQNVPWSAFIPFGDGVHKCIGYQFALTEISLVAALLLRRYRFAIDPKFNYVEKAHVTLNPVPEPKLLVTRIKNDEHIS